MPMFESRLRRSLRWRGAFLLLAAAAVDLLSHGSKLEGHFCMHEDTTFTINNPPPHHTYLSLSLRHPGTNALRPAIQSPSSMIGTNTIHYLYILIQTTRHATHSLLLFLCTTQFSPQLNTSHHICICTCTRISPSSLAQHRSSALSIMQHRAMPLSLMTPIGKLSESNSTPTIEHVLSFQAHLPPILKQIGHAAQQHIPVHE